MDGTVGQYGSCVALRYVKAMLLSILPQLIGVTLIVFVRAVKSVTVIKLAAC